MFSMRLLPALLISLLCFHFDDISLPDSIFSRRSIRVSFGINLHKRRSLDFNSKLVASKTLIKLLKLPQSLSDQSNQSFTTDINLR